MKPKINLTGQKFHNLTVIEEAQGYYSKGGSHRRRWLCRCDCGNYTIVNQENLYRKDHPTTSCGCTTVFWRNHKGPNAASHSERNRERLYHVWSSMKDRCYNQNCSKYKNYGARGISVCEEWRNSYDVFKAWALSTGYDENAGYGECTLERKDVHGNYCPENCCWITQAEQANNKVNTVKVELNGSLYTLTELSKLCNVPRKIISSRYFSDWSIDEILNVPVGMKRKDYYANKRNSA